MDIVKKLIALLLLIVLSQTVIWAADNLLTTAQQADAAYSKGDFKTAANLYHQLLDQGVKRSEIYFNLGNAYYQLQDLGRALVNYRRAQLSTPRDEDLQLNLTRVRVQRVDGLMPESGLAGQLVELTSDSLSLSELSWIVVALFWLCCGFVAAYIWRTDWRKNIRWVILISSLLFMFVAILTLTRIVVDNSLKRAVIIGDSVAVMTGPGDDYLEIFELHAAAEIRIVETHNDWVRFQLPDLREGWIQALAIEVI
jgi:tetratricopeptide (TPR) repeat protein